MQDRHSEQSLANSHPFWRKGENMNKVDELIEKLAEHITELIDKGYEEDIFDDTRALAELITARAHADKC